MPTTGCPSRRAGRAGSRSWPRSGRSAARGSSTSSSATAPTPAGWPNGSRRRPRVTILNEVVLNQVARPVRGLDDDPRTPATSGHAPSSRPSSATARAGSAGRPGPAVPRCASRSRAGRRPRTTSTRSADAILACCGSRSVPAATDERRPRSPDRTSGVSGRLAGGVGGTSRRDRGQVAGLGRHPGVEVGREPRGHREDAMDPHAVGQRADRLAVADVDPDVRAAAPDRRGRRSWGLCGWPFRARGTRGRARGPSAGSVLWIAAPSPARR